MEMRELQQLIETSFETRTQLTAQNAPASLKDAIKQVIELLDQGKLRVAEKINNQWHTHQWIKKAVLLYFRLHDNQVMDGGCAQYFDKVPLKFQADTLKN